MQMQWRVLPQTADVVSYSSPSSGSSKIQNRPKNGERGLFGGSPRGCDGDLKENFCEWSQAGRRLAFWACRESLTIPLVKSLLASTKDPLFLVSMNKPFFLLTKTVCMYPRGCEGGYVIRDPPESVRRINAHQCTPYQEPGFRRKMRSRPVHQSLVGCHGFERIPDLSFLLWAPGNVGKHKLKHRKP